MSDQHDEYSMTPPLSPMDMNSQEFGDDSEVVPFKKILLEGNATQRQGDSIYI